MKVKFYRRFLSSGDVEKVPNHYFFGAIQLREYDMEIDLVGDSSTSNKLVRATKLAYKLIFTKQPYDILYAATASGLEVLILLKCLGLFKKPIVTWQHRTLKTTNNKFVKLLLRFYYSGISTMFMFSPLHIEESISAGVTEASKLKYIEWGPDLVYYNTIESSNILNPDKEKYFCSTGKENRDFVTLMKAFENTPDSHLKIYTTKRHGHVNNEEIILGRNTAVENIKISFIDGNYSLNGFLSNQILNCYCAVICCNEHDYTVGLTCLIEAMALGKPVIISNNPYFPFDVEKEEVGIKVEYGDVSGWVEAIKYLSDNEHIAYKMGKNAQKFVKDKYNSDILSHNVSYELRSLCI